MTDETTIERFCGWINAALDRGAVDESTMRTITTELGEGGASAELIALLSQALARAGDPSVFFEQRVLGPDERFAQCYQLLTMVFDEAERDPLDRFHYMLHALADPANDHPLVMMGRFWRVLGSQEYSATGELRRFAYDPLSVTESIVSLVSGNYMSLNAFGHPGESFGAIGHLATRERFRRGRGHGAALLHAFEAEMARIAQARGEQSRLILLEAQTDSQIFWYKQGYRWAVGTRYAQPPLDFNPETGERLYDEVPETLMLKRLDEPDAPSIPAGLLADAVRTMYQNWSLEKTLPFPPAAARRARDYVEGKVLREFLASLPANGEAVRLGPPPALSA